MVSLAEEYMGLSEPIQLFYRVKIIKKTKS